MAALMKNAATRMTTILRPCTCAMVFHRNKTFKRDNIEKEKVRTKIWVDYDMLHKVFNKFDRAHIGRVGQERAAAEWITRCGGAVRIQDVEEWFYNYNNLGTGPLGKFVIEEIDASWADVQAEGFDHLDGLKAVRTMKFSSCLYLQDACLERLAPLSHSLHSLEISHCGQLVTDRGILALQELKLLQRLHLADLPGVKDPEVTLQTLQSALPSCFITAELGETGADQTAQMASQSHGTDAIL
ncbi:ATP5SL [Branchiostoma lanceolatum]|uniref:ATP5SL protein n=1 Tax=Branchiostoma lanceolatum TaxID=7740 RepID=A0A8J9ZR50_BRALA|nr:ATP5SL [Branchiostoma lanceolatum]